jgi:enoyl-CoA hydratase/carnithine racemase
MNRRLFDFSGCGQTPASSGFDILCRMSRLERVYLEVQGAMARIVLNRPELLNATDVRWVDDFHSVLDELEAVPGVRVAVLCGQGRSFSTGIDLKALSNGEIQIDWFRRWDEGLHRLERLGPVTIAQIHGYALGGGLQIALACDLRIATPDARLGLPAVLEALIPGMGTYRLPRFVGLGRARRLVLTGEMISAEEALRIGLVDWVAPQQELNETTETIIASLLKGGATALSLSKKLVTSSFEMSFEDAFGMYLDYQQHALASDEHRRAMDEYRKRKSGVE